MRLRSIHIALAAFLPTTLLASTSMAQRSELPAYLKNISAMTSPPSAADIAARDVVQLNTTMFTLYESAARNIVRVGSTSRRLRSSASVRTIVQRSSAVEK